MKVLITGATGLVGSEVVRQAIADPAVGSIVLLTRRQSAFDHPKVKQVIHADFMNYDGLQSVFQSVDACLWCLGISQNRVSKNEYFRITYEYVVAAANAMVAARPSIVFVFVSGQGADSRERSPVRFAKIKGQAENALIQIQPGKLFIFRPGGIIASTKTKDETPYKKFESLGVRIMAAVFPWSVISTADLAKAMLRVARNGYPKTILSHRNIMNLGVSS